MLRTTIAALGLLAATIGTASPHETVTIPLGDTGWTVDFDNQLLDVNYVPATAAYPNTGFDHLTISTIFSQSVDSKTNALVGNMGDHILQFHHNAEHQDSFGLRISVDIQVVNETNFDFDGIEIAAITNFETAVENFSTLPEKNLAHPGYAHFHPESVAPGYIFHKPLGGRGDFGPLSSYDGPDPSKTNATMDLGLNGLFNNGTTARILPGDVITFRSIGLHKSTRRIAITDNFMLYLVPILPAPEPPPSCNCQDQPPPVGHASVQALALIYPAMQRLMNDILDPSRGTVDRFGILHDPGPYPPPADWPLEKFLDDGQIVSHHTLDGRF